MSSTCSHPCVFSPPICLPDQVSYRTLTVLAYNRVCVFPSPIVCALSCGGDTGENSTSLEDGLCGLVNPLNTNRASISKHQHLRGSIWWSPPLRKCSVLRCVFLFHSTVCVCVCGCVRALLYMCVCALFYMCVCARSSFCCTDGDCVPCVCAVRVCRACVLCIGMV